MLMLFIESVFGSLFVLIYSSGQNPFHDVIKFYNELDKKMFLLLLFLLFLYFAFSAGVNVYKVLSNVLYSPMAKSVSIYVLNPLLIIYSFIFDNDFLYEGEQNVLYLILNVILSIIIIFFGCVYNEFFILGCCNLEYKTHYGISMRANRQNQLIEFNDLRSIFSDDNDDYEFQLN